MQKQNMNWLYADYENTLFLNPKNQIAALNRDIVIKILRQKLGQT